MFVLGWLHTAPCLLWKLSSMSFCSKVFLLLSRPFILTVRFTLLLCHPNISTLVQSSCGSLTSPSYVLGPWTPFFHFFWRGVPRLFSSQCFAALLIGRLLSAEVVQFKAWWFLVLPFYSLHEHLARVLSCASRHEWICQNAVSSIFWQIVSNTTAWR